MNNVVYRVSDVGGEGLVTRVRSAIASADEGFTDLPDELLRVEGMSSVRIRILLNDLCRYGDCRYLEVGTFKGSTVLVASYQNCGSFISIDNFSEFGGTRGALLENQQRWSEYCRFQFIESDAWEVKPESVGPVNVFFYDGSHREADQYKAFTHFDSAFTAEFIAIVDDWNEPAVCSGTRQAFRDLKYKVQCDWQLASALNGERVGWWNGLYIAVVQKAQV